jgi:hypothetical protein
MSDDRQSAKEGLLGKARRLAEKALIYARSDEANAKLAEVKKKAVEVGGVTADGTRSLAKKASQVASHAKEKAEAFARSEQAEEIRVSTKGLWERSKVIKIRGVPWMESPIAIGLVLVLFFPLGLWLVWRQPAWSKAKKMIWTGGWAGLLVLGLAERGRENQPEQALPRVNNGSLVPLIELGTTNTSATSPLTVPWNKGDRGFLAGPPLRTFDSVVTYLAEEDGWDEMIAAEKSGDLERLATLCGEHKMFQAPWGSQVEILSASDTKFWVRTKNREEGFIQPAFVSQTPPEIQRAPRTFYKAAMHVPSDTKLLTEDYYPHRNGFEKNFLSEILMPGDLMTRNWSTETQGPGGMIESKNVKTTVVNEDGQERVLEKTLPQPKFPDQYRVSEGFVEIGDHLNNEKAITWHRVLKIGAKKGESWKQALSKSLEHEYTVLDFTTYGSGPNPESCAVIERKLWFRKPNGLVMQGITQYDYVRGIGITHSVTNMKIGDQPMRTTATTKLLMSRMVSQ